MVFVNSKLPFYVFCFCFESFARVATTSSQNFALQFYAEKTTFLRGKHLEYLPLWASQHHQILQTRPYFNEFSLRRKDWLAPFSCNSSMPSVIPGMGVWRHEIYCLRSFMYWLYHEVDLEPQQLMPFFIWNNTWNLSQKLVIPHASTKQRLEFRPFASLGMNFVPVMFYVIGCVLIFPWES